jgi:serine/threonine protein kinase
MRTPSGVSYAVSSTTRGQSEILAHQESPLHDSQVRRILKHHSEGRISYKNMLGQAIGFGSTSIIRSANNTYTGNNYGCKIISVRLDRDEGSASMQSDAHVDEAHLVVNSPLSPSMAPPSTAGGPTTTRRIVGSQQQHLPTHSDVQLELDSLCEANNQRGVVDRVEWFIDGNTYYVNAELLEGEDLLSLLCGSHPSGRLEEHEARDLVQNILVGLQSLHNRNIIYGDVKLDNNKSRTPWPTRLCEARRLWLCLSEHLPARE